MRAPSSAFPLQGEYYLAPEAYVARWAADNRQCAYARGLSEQQLQDVPRRSAHMVRPRFLSVTASRDGGQHLFIGRTCAQQHRNDTPIATARELLLR